MISILPTKLSFNHRNTCIIFLLFITFAFPKITFAQCSDGNDGDACGCPTGSLIATLQPSNTNHSWDNLNWYRFPSSGTHDWTNNNNYLEWYNSVPGAIYEIAMDGYTNDEVTVCKSDGSGRIQRDADNNGDGERFFYTCPTTGNYRIRISRGDWSLFGGYDNCLSYNGWMYLRIRAIYPCSGTLTYGTNQWNGYVYDGTGPDYYYGSIGTQTWNNINQDYGNGQPISTGCGMMCDNDNYSTLWLMNRTYSDGVYVFSTPGNDDGRVLSNNGGLSWNLINNWGSGSGTTTTNPVAMNGNYNMRFYHRENSGGSRARLTTCQMGGGNLNVYGSGSWNVYVYDEEDFGFDVADYAGTFTRGTASATSAVLTAFSDTYARDNRTGTCGTGCGSDNSVRALISNNFNAGLYRIEIGRDDNYRLSVDGGATFPFTGGCCSNATFYTFLSGNTNIVYQGNDTGGGGEYYASITNANPVANAVSANACATSGYQANWNAVSGATIYYIDIATDAGFTNLLVNNQSTTNTYYPINFPAGQTYYYRVRVSNGTITSTNSNTITATITASNDFITNATNLGNLQLGLNTQTLELNSENNIGSTNESGEPWVNDGGSDEDTDWYYFTTGSNAPKRVEIGVEENGNDIDVDFRLYRLNDNNYSFPRCGVNWNKLNQVGEGNGVRNFMEFITFCQVVPAPPLSGYDSYETFNCLQSNSTYYIQVKGRRPINGIGLCSTPNDDEGDFKIFVKSKDVIAGDDICDAPDISSIFPGGSFTSGENETYGKFSNYCASNESNEPLIESSSDKTVWVKFRTGNNVGSEIEIDLDGSDDDCTVLLPGPAGAVYKVDESVNCNLIFVDTFYAQVNDLSTGIGAIDNIRFCPSPNTTYYLQVQGNDPVFCEKQLFEAHFSMNTGTPTRPNNDDICDATGSNYNFGTVDANDNITKYGGNDCASMEAAEYSIGGAGQNEATVWYQFTTPASTTNFPEYIEVDANGTGGNCSYLFGLINGTYFPRVKVFKKKTTSTCPTFATNNTHLELVPDRENNLGIYFDLDQTYHLLECVEPSTTYYIQVYTGNFSTCDAGTFNLEVTAGPATPQNDYCIGAPDYNPIGENTYNVVNIVDDNINATNCHEPNPGWSTNGNDRGVWYKLNSVPGRTLVIDANQIVSDRIDIQLALYEGPCTPTSDLGAYVDRDWFAGWYLGCINADGIDVCNEDWIVTCLDPTKEYYLMVDGAGDPLDFIDPFKEGRFDIDIYYPYEGGRKPCTTGGHSTYPARNIGTVPDDNNTNWVEYRNTSNYCGLTQAEFNAAGYPTPGFDINKAVWYQFTTPNTPDFSGAVEFLLESDPHIGDELGGVISSLWTGDEINLEAKVYRSSDGTCSGTMVPHEGDSYSAGFNFSCQDIIGNTNIEGSFDETLIVTCLDANTDYWLLVDGDDDNLLTALSDLLGASSATEGLFSIKMRNYQAYKNSLVAGTPSDPYFDMSSPNDLQQNAIPWTVNNSQITTWNDCNSTTDYTVTLNNQNNYCADNINEPSTIPEWGSTEAIVWYEFTAPPSGVVSIQLETGGVFNYTTYEWMNAKLAIFDLPDGENLNTYTFNTTSDLVCSDFDEVQFCAGPGAFVDIWGNEELFCECLIPGRTYYLAVDGGTAPCSQDEGLTGEFDLNFTAMRRDAPAPNDSICNATDLGPVPAGGADLSSKAIRDYRQANGIPPYDVWPYNCMNSENNFCASPDGDPDPDGVFPLSFDVDNGVWYTFIAPPKGAVQINVNSNPSYASQSDEVATQIAVFEQVGGSCATPDSFIAKEFTNALSGIYDTELKVSCLEPGKEYYLLIDGVITGVNFCPVLFGDEWQGYFDFTIKEIDPFETPPANELICNATHVTPTAGGVTLTNQTNRCAIIELDIPIPSTFQQLDDNKDNTVWYSFTTPNTPGPHAVKVDINGAVGIPFVGDWLDPQMALFESDNVSSTNPNVICNPSTNNITEVFSDYYFYGLPFFETTEFHCLDQNRTYFLMVDGSSWNRTGDFDITFTTITAHPIPDNDLICAANDGGPGDLGDLVNTLYSGVQNNFCSTVEAGEPIPEAFGLDQTVWFSFTTPDLPGDVNVSVDILLDSDPTNLGEDIDLQVAIYQSSNGTCSGDLFEIQSQYFPSLAPPITFLNSFCSDGLCDEDLTDICLAENTRYFIQVDGVNRGLPWLKDFEGYFDIEIINNGPSLKPLRDNICNAGGDLSLGTTYYPENNYCATLEPGEPGSGSYAQRTVWYSFIAPASQDVTIVVKDYSCVSPFTDYPSGGPDCDDFGDFNVFDAEVHLFESDNGLCNGNLSELASSDNDYVIPYLDETIASFPCLKAGERYFIQVDGTTVGGLDGIFSIEITDNYPNYGTNGPAPPSPTDPEPINNFCADAIDLTSNIQTSSCFYGSGSWKAENYGHPSFEMDAVGGCGNNCGETWFKFDMPATGFVKIEGQVPTVLGVRQSDLTIHAYRGTCGASNLTFIKCGGGKSNNPDFSISGTPGETIFLQVFDDSGNDLENLGIPYYDSNYDICISERCSADDCNDAVVITSEPIATLGDSVGFGTTLCWDVYDATREVSTGYNVCGGRPDNKSVYFQFQTDPEFCLGYEIEINTPSVGSNEFIGEDELFLSVYEDATPCDGTYDGQLDCESWNGDNSNPPAVINHVIPYYIGENVNNIKSDKTYIIQVDGTEYVSNGTIEVRKMCEGRTYGLCPVGVTSSDGYCEGEGEWRHYYDDAGTPLDPSDDYLMFSIDMNGNNFDGVATVTLLPNYTAAESPGVAATYTMRRYWDFEITSGTLDPLRPVGVRFYYEQYEKTEIINAAVSFASTHGLNVEPFEWFKTTNNVSFSPTMVHPRYIEDKLFSETGQFTPYIFDLPPDGIMGSNASPFDYGGTGQDYDDDNRNIWCNDIQYVELYGLTGFSGGTGAAGASDSLQSPLPVELISFTGWNNGSVNELEWITATEINNEVFVVERSPDAINFVEIGSVPGNGTTSEEHQYNFTDETPIQGVNYYRLKQIDFDGTFEYSSIIVVKVHNDLTKTAIIKLHPNPANELINLQLQSEFQTIFDVTILDLTGRVVDVLEMPVIEGLNEPFSLDVKTYPQGVYLINLVDRTLGNVYDVKFVKQ